MVRIGILSDTQISPEIMQSLHDGIAWTFENYFRGAKYELPYKINNVAFNKASSEPGKFCADNIELIAYFHNDINFCITDQMFEDNCDGFKTLFYQSDTGTVSSIILISLAAIRIANEQYADAVFQHTVRHELLHMHPMFKKHCKNDACIMAESHYYYGFKDDVGELCPKCKKKISALNKKEARLTARARRAIKNAWNKKASNYKLMSECHLKFIENIMNLQRRDK